MHYTAIFRIVAKEVGNNLAESIREQAFVNIFYGFMNIVFCGRNTSLRIFVGHSGVGLFCD